MKTFNIQTKQELGNHLKVHPLEIDQVLADRRRLYRSFKRTKPDGAFRVIYDPQGPLRLLQKKINSHILDFVPMPDCVHGGVRHRSVVTNARPHIGKEIVFCLDIKDFYPSVESRVVDVIFKYLGFGPEASEILTAITTWDNQLPQGVPTSSALANLALTRVDGRLFKLACQQGFDYTRWSDDLTLSGHRRLLDFRRLIERIVVEEGFSIKPEKVRTMHSGMRQVVTGIVVNKKLNIPCENRRLIRKGVLQVQARRDSGDSLYKVRGKVSWLSQVNPTLGARLSKRLPGSGGLKLVHGM